MNKFLTIVPKNLVESFNFYTDYQCRVRTWSFPILTQLDVELILEEKHRFIYTYDTFNIASNKKDIDEWCNKIKHKQIEEIIKKAVEGPQNWNSFYLNGQEFKLSSITCL